MCVWRLLKLSWKHLEVPVDGGNKNLKQVFIASSSSSEYLAPGYGSSNACLHT